MAIMRRHMVAASLCFGLSRSCRMGRRALATSGRDVPSIERSSVSVQEKKVEELWRAFFSDPSQWWDHRTGKLNSRYPDFKHKKTQEALWLNGDWKPPWVDAELAAMAPGAIQASLFSWTSRLAKHVKDGHFGKAMELFKEMQEHGIYPDKFTYVQVLGACANLRALEKGRSVHKDIIRSSYESDIFVANSLISMYAKCASIEESRRVFSNMARRDVVSWNAMIQGYVKCGLGQKALELFDQMEQEGVQPDAVTFVVILSACASEADIEKGRHVHQQIIRRGWQTDTRVGNSIVNMYTKCGTMEDAQEVFNQMPKRNVVSWNALILGYVNFGQALKALQLSQQMQWEGVEPVSVTFVGLLNACASLSALEEGRLIHEQIIEKGYESDAFVVSSLVDMYAKCGSIDDAWKVFNEMPKRDLVAWTAMMKGYVKCGQGRKALELSQQLHGQGLEPDPVTFVVLLNACASVAALEEGRHLHDQIVQSKYDSFVFMGNSLIDMYAKCGSIGDASAVFSGMRKRDVVSWTTMIQAYVKSGQGQKSLELCKLMSQEGVEPDPFTFSGFLNACASVAALEDGKIFHKQIVQKGWQSDVSISNSLIDMYSKCGSIDDAWGVFKQMPVCNVVSWNSMIQGFVNCGEGQKALELFRESQEKGVEPLPSTFVGVLSACARLGMLEEGRRVHGEISQRGSEPNILISNSLIDMYTKCGSLEEALTVFHRMPSRNLVSWNAVIGGCVKCGQGQLALDMYQQMQQEGMETGPVTFVTVLNACAQVLALEKGKSVHEQIIQSGCQSDIFISNSLIHMYNKCGSVEAAWGVFTSIPQRDVVSWNTMIHGLVKCGQGQEALELSRSMHKDGVAPNPITLVGLLNACASIGALTEGRLVHERIIQGCYESDLFVCNSLIDMYSKCGSVKDAWSVFNKMHTRDVISWNVMIQGYVKCSQGERALELFRQMQGDEVLPNHVTLVLLLNACASIGALEAGRFVHKQITQNDCQSNISVCTSLIEMYSKCGSIDDACSVFNKMPVHSVVSWTVMLQAYAMHGCAMEALCHFNQMCQEGVRADGFTLVSLLSACSHAGLVEEGLHLFDSMGSTHTIPATVEHFTCIVHLLGRAGCLHRAEDMIKTMSCDPDAFVWLSLLAACRVHGNVEMGGRIAERVVELDPGNAAGDVLLSNIYAAASTRDKSATMRQKRLNRGAKKQPGRTWIEVNNEVHSFRADDQDHPQNTEIRAELERLSRKMENAGYVPDTSLVLYEDLEEGKLSRLCHHSEKLAIGFALLNTQSGSPIHIFKNLRVCGDCHTAAKFISKIEGRKIIARDTNRFHHFEDGLCSCGDYW